MNKVKDQTHTLSTEYYSRSHDSNAKITTHAHKTSPTYKRRTVLVEMLQRDKYERNLMTHLWKSL